MNSSTSTLWDALLQAPPDRIFLVVGLGFLALSLVRRIPGGGTIHTDQRMWARIFGGACLLISLFLMIVVSKSPTSSSPQIVTSPVLPTPIVLPIVQLTPNSSTPSSAAQISTVPPIIQPSVLPSIAPPPTTVTTVPLPGVPSVSTSFVGNGPCSLEAVNQYDDVPGDLDAERWYVMLTYDNNVNPPWQRWEAKQGPRQVSGNSFAGQRAWECVGQGAALGEALRVAQGEKAKAKANNHVLQVFGPDGSEIP